MNKPHLTNTNRAGQSGMFLSTFVTGMFTNFKLSIVNLERKQENKALSKIRNQIRRTAKEQAKNITS